METFTCPACGDDHRIHERVDPGAIAPTTAEAIAANHPGWAGAAPICRDCVNEGRAAEAEAILEAEMGELSGPEREVVATIRDERLITVDTEDEFEADKDPSERAAHRVAATIGSWGFTALVLVGLVVWILVNVAFQPFEPYPIILFATISAALAGLAALEGPVILMSQRHQRMRDRERSKTDYAVNLKAELEIRLLEDKLDLVLATQRMVAEELAELRSVDRSAPESA